MPLAVHTNVTSLHIQRRLTDNNSRLTNNFRRLATGMKTITAADNASGLAISERLVSNVNGISQAIKNANDGISMAQTAETGLEDIRDILQRLGELRCNPRMTAILPQTVQAISTRGRRFDWRSREHRHQHRFQWKKSARRVFAGCKDSHRGGKSRQCGIFRGIRACSSFGVRCSGRFRFRDGSGARRRGCCAQRLCCSGKRSGGRYVFVCRPGRFGDFQSCGNQLIDGASRCDRRSQRQRSYRSAEIADAGGTLDGTNYVEINGVRIQGDVSNDDSDGALRAAINAVSGQTGVTASLDEGAGGDKKLVLRAEDGRNITVAAGGTGSTITGLSTGTTYGMIKLESNQAINVTSNGSAANAGLSTGITEVNRSNNLSTIDLTTHAGAMDALDTIDKASSQVSSQVAKLGATFKWLEASVNNLGNQVQNVSDARARIVDVDVASETTDLSKSQILTQVTSTMLAQANVSHDGVLKLL